MKPILGSCLCESVKFSVAAGSLNLYQCHCSVCRKVSGSASGTALFVRKASFAWLGRQEQVGVFRRESGYSVHFCSTCGSPLPHEFMGEYVWVPAGLLDADAAGNITAHLHVGSKAEWEPMPLGGVHFPDSPTLDELLQMTVCGEKR